MKDRKSSQFYNQSIEKCFKVIEAITNSESSYLGISKITKITCLDKSSIYRIINTLYDLGYLSKNKNSEYGLSNSFIVVTNRLLSKMDDRKIVGFYLKQISAHTNHFSTFSKIENNRAILIDKEEAKTSLRVHSGIGKTYPLNCSAAGKAYLSLLSDDEINNLYKKITLVKMTENSITDLKKLKEDLKITRLRGYSINNQEHDIYRLSIAVPIKNMEGDFVGTLGISMPAMAQEKNKIDEYGQYLKTISAELSKKLVRQ